MLLECGVCGASILGVDYGLQAHGHLHDHHAVCLELCGELTGGVALQQVRKRKQLQPLASLDDGDDLMQQAVNSMAPISWHLDVHQHANEVATRFEAGVRAIVPERQAFHRKPYFADDTKMAIRTKASLRQQLLSQGAQRRHGLPVCLGMAAGMEGGADRLEWP